MSEKTYYRVCFMPRLDAPVFRYRVESIEVGTTVMGAIALYDQFLVDNGYSPDIANCAWIDEKEFDGEWEAIDD